MPTVLRVGPYRFFFYSNEGSEPPHIHVQREQSLAKFWLDPVGFSSSYRFSARELRRVERIVAENSSLFRKAWDDYFGS